MLVKILFRIPCTCFFLAYCKDERYIYFSVYKKMFGSIDYTEEYGKIKIDDNYYWEEI